MAKAVTLDDILVGPKKVEIPVRGKTEDNAQGMPDVAKLTLWVRAAQQPERDLAGSAARKESRLLRKKLEDPDTEEHQNLIKGELEDASVDSLRQLWVTEKIVERAVKIRGHSLEEREYVPEPEGDDITSKDVDDYENAVEAAEESREIGVVEAIVSARKELEKEVKSVPEDKLLEMAIPAQVEAILTRTYEYAFVCQLIYRCTFSDRKCTKKAFSDIEKVYSLREEAMTLLTNAHMSFMLDPEQVKNLAGGLNF